MTSNPRFAEVSKAALRREAQMKQLIQNTEFTEDQKLILGNPNTLTLTS